MQLNLGEAAVWFSNARNNYAPFAGFMLRDYRRVSLESAAEEIEAVEATRPGGETTGNEFEDVH